MCETLDLPLALPAGCWPTWPPKQGREPQSQPYRQDENCEVNKKPKAFFKKSKCTSLYMNILSIITNLINEGRSSSTEALGIGNRMQLSQRSSKSDAAAVSHKKYCCFLLKIQHRASSHIITMKISSLLLLCTL